MKHEFVYPLFMACLDIDRIAELMKVSSVTSHNRWNWATFDDRDHFGDPRQPLRERLAIDAHRAGVTLPDGPIYLLTHLRYLGYCFNPISFFYCFDRDRRLVRVLAEVNNTFGGAHNYWLEPDTPSPPDHAPAESVHAWTAAASKQLYVSPFMPAGLDYRFALSPPGKWLVAHIAVSPSDRDDSFFDATLSLQRQPWSARDIYRTLVRYPWMTAKVIAAIHWQASRLWWKGVPVVPRPSGSRVWPDAPRAGATNRVVE